MTRLLFTRSADILITVAGWGLIVVLLGMPGVVLVALAVTAMTNAKGIRSEPGDPRVWGPPEGDDPPVLLAITAGRYARGDRAEVLLADHPPDLILIGRSNSLVLLYGGGQSKGVRGVYVIAEDGRLVGAVVVAEQGQKGGLENPFAPLPLVVRHGDDTPAFSRLETRRSLLAVTGGGGVLFHRD
jgi:hypothetical protein